MKVLTAEQMRQVDRLTSERYNIPGIQLMENAAGSVVREALARYGPLENKTALIVCGRGNNGGDGAAAARLLSDNGVRIRLVLQGRVEDSRGDARTNFNRARQIASTKPDRFELSEVSSPEEFDRAVEDGDYQICFDAIFGTGLTRPAEGLYNHAITFLNSRRNTGSPIVAVDIPSGVPSDSSELIGPAVRADLTVTFTAPKLGNVLPPACYLGGKLVVADIGSPDELIQGCGSNLNLVDGRIVRGFLKASRRGPDANKGDAGKVLIIAGSRGKTGAAALAGAAAMRAGAGLVTVATAASSQQVIASRLVIECMTEPLPETADGAISADAVHQALDLASARDVTGVGPGLGSADSSTREFVRETVMRRATPMVIDADGLNALAPWTDSIKGTADLPIILTPHPGEMARLADSSIAAVLADRVNLARGFATEHSVILVLKGSRTLIAAPDGQVYINPTGNEGMASGGTGDVLTGITSGLLAQHKSEPVGAAIAAVYLHGLAGDIAASQLGIRTMIASDITDHLGQAFIEAGGNEERLTR